MSASVLLALLSAAPVKVAAPGLAYVGFDAQLGSVYMDRFVSLLQEAGPIKVTTARDMEQLLGLERQRQLLGCDQSSACLAELSGALGVDAVLGGSLARTSSGLLVTLRAVRSSDGSEVATASGRLAAEADLGTWLEAQAPAMARRLLAAFGVAAPPEAEVKKTGAPLRWERWVPGAVGVVAVAVGAGLWAKAGQDAATLRGDVVGLTEQQIRDTARDGRTMQVAGPALVAVGVAGLAASAAWLVLAPAEAPAVAAVPLAGGGLVVVEGRF